MLKTLSNKSLEFRKRIVWVTGDSKKEHKNKVKLDGKDEVGSSEVDDNEIGDNDVTERKNHQKTSKSKKLFKYKKTIRSLDFFTPRVRLMFTKLREAFVKTPIFHHFNAKCHI